MEVRNIYDSPQDFDESLEFIRVHHPRLTVKEHNMLDLAGVDIRNLSNADRIVLGRMYEIAQYNQVRGAHNGD